MKDSESPKQLFTTILADILPNIAYLAGIALIDLFIRPLFGSFEFPLISNLLLVIMEIGLLIGLIGHLFRTISRLTREIERTLRWSAIGRRSSRMSKAESSVVRLALRSFAGDFVFIVVTVLTITAIGCFIYINQVSVFGVDPTITMLSFMIATALVFMLMKMPRGQKNVVRSNKSSVKSGYTLSSLLTRVGVEAIIGALVLPLLIYNIGILLSILIPYTLL